MAGVVPLEFGTIGKQGQGSFGVAGIFGAGVYEIEGAKEVEGGKHLVYLRAHGVGQSCQYAHYFAALLYGEFAQSIVCFHHFCRLYEECLA